jgi:acyl-coenzyme A synthetase/AMP-(fatty) acid ligase
MRDWYEKKTLGALLDEAAARWSAREALTFECQRWSFAQLRTEVDRTARACIALGMQAGDRVALWMPNRPEWLYTFFALAKIGAVVVPINTRFRTSDLAYVLWQSDATTLMTVDRSGPVDSLAMVHEICPSLPRVAAHPGWSLLTVAPSPSSQHSSDLEPFQHATALPSPAAPRGVMPAVGIIHSTHLQHQAHGHP